MCGILGLISKSDSGIDKKRSFAIINRLFKLSESRGMESSGIAVNNTALKQIHIFKTRLPASKFIKTSDFGDFYNRATGSLFYNAKNSPFMIMGHSRLATDGSCEDNSNNQPVSKEGCVVVHNGIVANVNQLWKKFYFLKREFIIDTEIITSLVRFYLSSQKSITSAVRQIFSEIEGSVSMGLMMADSSKFVAATNTGSFYYWINPQADILIFASEKYILKEVIRKHKLKNNLVNSDILHLNPGQGLCMDIAAEKGCFFFFSLSENEKATTPEMLSATPYAIIDYLSACGKPVKRNVQEFNININGCECKRKMLEYNLGAIRILKRCKKCLLPETFPFISFDEESVCNYCNNYVMKAMDMGKDELRKKMEGYRRKNALVDCIVSFSGGRDSSYGLHYVKKELGLNPVTFTYDWGMVTDLARRNIARITGKLGIENILISANIRKKRENIRKNILAWLKKPDLGIIPLFMAGDKHFFYYAKKIQRQTGAGLNIWMGNFLETTEFKVGFCGVNPDFNKNRPDALGLSKKIMLCGYFASRYIANPAYLNSSIWDTISSFYSYYGLNTSDFFMLYNFIRWDEKKILDTLIKEYNWETSLDTVSTWRIGDGTAAFYNYIYFTIGGFSEIDSFRSNQIREGMLSREEAMLLAEKENQPRYESIQWYCDTVGIDFERTIKAINKVPKLY